MKKDIYWLGDKDKDEKSGQICGSENDSDDDNNQVVTVNNRIYFYSEVSRSKNLDLNKSIVNLGINLQNRAVTLSADPGKIYLHINSYGGSVFAGLSSVDYIIKSKIPVVSVIDGCAASAATLMSVTASHRQMNKHAYMLIHQLSSGLWGKYEEMKDDMENCDSFMKVIKEIYAEHTSVPKKELDKILKHDLWWDAETCLKYGLVDEII